MLFLCLSMTAAFSQQKSEAQLRSEAIRAFHDYAAKGQTSQAVESGVKAAQLYYAENSYQEAFDLLRDVDAAISANRQQDAKTISAQRYKVVRERMAMYMKMRRSDRVKEQLENMERHANASANEEVKNDLLYNQAIYYYTFGQNAKGDAVFKEMAAKLTTQKEYGKVDEVYRTLIANGRRSGSASLVAQAYTGYIAWKDSVSALKAAAERDSLKQQIAAGEASIAEKDSALASRQGVIIALCTLAVILAAALVIGGLLLMRFIYLTRKQKKTIRRANENNALKAKFISNISAQLTPTLQRLNNQQPEVRALQDFAAHIQMLSQLEADIDQPVELEDTPLQPFCKELMSKINGLVKENVMLTVNAPNMSAMINKEYTSHILIHLLTNAAIYTPEGGHIWLDFKKRGAHKQQFLVTNTGSVIPEDQRENIFKPFLEVKDLTTGDGLGLPICRQMAIRMNGDLEIDPEFTKGTRFVLNLSV